MPSEHKDANDWTRAGATAEEIFAAMQAAEPILLPIVNSISALPKQNNDESAAPNASPPDEIAELVELARAAFAQGAATSATSTNPAGDNTQPAIFPADSILADWMHFAQAQEESANAFLISSILPVCAAMLGRRVWFQCGARRKYTNLFVMLTGKPGDRKSSRILLAENIARLVLPENAFLPASFNPEAMFNEYAEETGGLPDKLWIVDDANATLKDWQKSVNGERVATRFLELYDSKSLSESFQRNRKETANRQARRTIPQTSTSLLFGATFNIAAFQGQEVRAGMSRRFLYYIAERHGRLIVRPGVNDDLAFTALAEGFTELLTPSGEMDFSPEAATIWGDYTAFQVD
jgi:hypothetical protein